MRHGQPRSRERQIGPGPADMHQRGVFDRLGLDVVEHHHHLVALQEGGRVAALEHHQQLVVRDHREAEHELDAAAVVAAELAVGVPDGQRLDVVREHAAGP
ncbi:MAG: hypothetical protein ACK559_23405, partial [bacterium]